MDEQTVQEQAFEQGVEDARELPYLDCVDYLNVITGEGR